MSGPVRSKTPHTMHAGSRGPATRQRLAGPAAPASARRPCVLMLAPASSQMRGPTSVAPVAEKLIDAVVNISTSQTVKGPEGVPLPKVPKGAPFEEFFEDFFNRKGGRSPSDRKVSSLGSGFVIDGKEGIVVTNNHVIEGADEIIVNFNDGTKLKVDKVLGKDTKTDLALLKVTPKKPLPAVPFGSSDQDAGRRLGDGDRQPVRPRRLGDGRHHLGQAARHQLRPLRRLPADGRRHQQGQLRRPAVQHGRRGHRREHGDHLADRRLDRHRLCRAVGHGPGRHRSAAPVRRDAPRLARGQDPDHHRGHRRGLRRQGEHRRAGGERHARAARRPRPASRTATSS